MVRHLYIHVPYCHRICPYCSFYKHTPGGTDHRAFVDALLAEIDHHRENLDLSPHTIYLGGGTPTALSQTHLGILLDGIAQRLDLSGLEEWDVEANPATFGEDKAKLMRDAGVTRVSLGVQSWTPATLKTLGRDHSPEQAEAAFLTLRETGFPSLNLDLMFSVPGQTAEGWRSDLEHTLTLAPDHISTYNLNYEEDTEFFEKLKSGEFDDDPERDAGFFGTCVELLESAGYGHYEISNYARAGHQSRHNASYWAGADYLGIGPGAFSTIDGKRWRGLPDTAGYIAAVGRGDFPSLRTEQEVIDAAAFRSERIALELRTARGIELSYLSERKSELEQLESAGLVERSGTRLRLTRKGKLLADPIATEFI